MPWAKWFVCLSFGLALCGCGGAAQQQAEEESTLKSLAVLYGQFTGQHRGQPPANEAEFKAFVESQNAEWFQLRGISDRAQVWISNRDKQPYVVLYGPVTGPPGPAGKPVIAYESKGVGGKRMVASELGAVDEVDESRFKELVPNAVAP